MKSTRRNFLKSTAAIAVAPIVCNADAELDARLSEQTRTTDAQIKELKLKTDKLRNKVLNEDLRQPLDSEIEKLMVSILEGIQKKANQSTEALLLGSSE